MVSFKRLSHLLGGVLFDRLICGRLAVGLSQGPLSLEPERIHDHVFSVGARIWIQPKRIQIRILPELDPKKPDLDPV